MQVQKSFRSSHPNAMICIARNYHDEGLTGALDQTECI